MYRSRKQLTETSKYHRRKGYNDTYEAGFTLLLDDYLIMMEQAEKNHVSVSNQIANVINSYIRDNNLRIEKEENKRVILSESGRLIPKKDEYVCVYVPRDVVKDVV